MPSGSSLALPRLEICRGILSAVRSRVQFVTERNLEMDSLRRIIEFVLQQNKKKRILFAFPTLLSNMKGQWTIGMNYVNCFISVCIIINRQKVTAMTS